MSTPEIPRRHTERFPNNPDDSLMRVHDMLLAQPFMPQEAQRAVADARRSVEQAEQGIAREFRESILPEIGPFLPERLVSSLESTSRTGAPVSVELLESFPDGLSSAVHHIDAAQHRAGAWLSPLFPQDAHSLIDAGFHRADQRAIPVQVQEWSAPQASLLYADDTADILMHFAPDQHAWISLQGPAYVDHFLQGFAMPPPMPYAPLAVPATPETWTQSRIAPVPQSSGDAFYEAEKAAKQIRSIAHASPQHVPPVSDAVPVRTDNALVRLIKEVGTGLKTVFFGAGGGLASVLAAIKSWFVLAEERAEEYTEQRTEERAARKDSESQEAAEADQPEPDAAPVTPQVAPDTSAPSPSPAADETESSADTDDGTSVPDSDDDTSAPDSDDDAPSTDATDSSPPAADSAPTIPEPAAAESEAPEPVAPPEASEATAPAPVEFNPPNMSVPEVESPPALPDTLTMDNFKNGFEYRGQTISVNFDTLEIQAGSKKWQILSRNGSPKDLINALSWDGQQLEIGLQLSSLGGFRIPMGHTMTKDEFIESLNHLLDSNEERVLSVKYNATSIKVATLVPLK